MAPKAENSNGMDVDEVKEEELEQYDWTGHGEAGVEEDSDEDEKLSRTSLPVPIPSTSKSSGTLVLTKDGKIRSQTFNQAWSVSEQHLLDKLLEQYPDGTKNRYDWFHSTCYTFLTLSFQLVCDIESDEWSSDCSASRFASTEVFR